MPRILYYIDYLLVKREEPERTLGATCIADNVVSKFRIQEVEYLRGGLPRYQRSMEF